MTTTDIRRFAYLQGVGRHRLGERRLVDDAEPTTTNVPPPHARTLHGRPLPLGTHALLAGTPYPGTPPPTTPGPGYDPLGHLLLTAFGLQRREPGNRHNDHRVAASGRARFPVHAFLAGAGPARYLDLHRHALVDLDVPDPAPDLPAPGADPTADAAGGTTVVLAARYQDLPAAYGRLTWAVCETELGFNLRALCLAAELFGVPAAVDLSGAACAAGAALVRSAGAGRWSAPVPVRLGAADSPAASLPFTPLPSVPLPDAGTAVPAEQDALLHRDDPWTAEAAAVSAERLGLPAAPPRPAPARPARLTRPARSAATGTTWAEVLWRRSSGRMPDQRYGFAFRPSEVPAEALRDLLDWTLTPPPHPLLAEVVARLRLTVALDGVAGLPTGLYAVEDGRVVLRRAAPRLPAALQTGFGQQPSPNTDNGVRHASSAWLFSVDLDALLADHGPAAFALLHLGLGWAMHGLCLAASAHGLAARPARSFDEHHVQPLFGLQRKDIPVFMTVCGTARHPAPSLDLRS
ncbi:hypothetical protein [Kitasatospora sp. NPDC086791]|uniref:nitroreductase family protein n=1 Tax=Kitasatospora sp. NPDC086791 TaxID=3155178 RepID=UPI003434315F